MSTFCRLCAQLKASKDMKATLNDPMSRIKEKLIECCRWNATTEDDDCLPETVCILCVRKLEQSWAFAESVTEAQTVLRKIFIPESFEDTKNAIDKHDFSETILFETNTNPAAMNFVAVKSEFANENDTNQSVAQAFEQSQIYDNLASVITRTESNESLNDASKFVEIDYVEQKHSSSIEDYVKPNKVDRKPTKDDTDFLSVLSKEDCNADGTITDEGVLKLNKTSWSDYQYNCLKCKIALKGVDEFHSHNESVHSSDSSPPQYTCSDCRKSFAKYFLLVRHVRLTHRPYLSYCCDICSKFFWNLKCWRIHRKKHTNEYGMFVCQTCGKIFNRKSHLAVHHRSHLPKELKNVFVCDICEKSYGKKDTLRTHMFTHFNTRQYTCELCGKSFPQKVNLVHHLAMHNSDKPYSCDMCDKTFKLPVLLKSHKRVHSDVKPHKCDTCGRDFRSRSTMKEHMRIHSGALPYACEFCGKSFRTSGVLRIHRRIHTGERPYSCKDCDHHFINWPNFNKHMKRRHGIDTSKRLIVSSGRSKSEPEPT